MLNRRVPTLVRFLLRGLPVGLVVLVAVVSRSGVGGTEAQPVAGPVSYGGGFHASGLTSPLTALLAADRSPTAPSGARAAIRARRTRPALGLSPGVTSAPPPAMTFTPNTRADAGGSGPNEPQVAVDQTGRAYAFWQGGTSMSSTDDGVTFTQLGIPSPDMGTGDTAVATTTWPSFSHTPSVAGSGDNGIITSALGGNTCGAIEMNGATSKNQGVAWSTVEITCQPAQVDRNWTAAYTPPAFRGTAQATAKTFVYNEYHDFGPSIIWVATSSDGGATYPTAPVSAMEPGSIQGATSNCDTIPGGIAVDQRGAHPGRVYAVWSTSDFVSNGANGCNLTQAEAFDHIFISYSDDNGATWHSRTVFNDPCAPTPPVPPLNPTTCQDNSEIFTAVAVDDAGNVYVTFVFRDITQAAPEFDVYVVKSSDGGNTFSAPRKVNAGTGTHYFPWITAGAADHIDIVFYDTPYVEGVGLNNKPAAAPRTAVWKVKLAQSFDGGLSFTENLVSDTDANGIYFGDICSTGIFCGLAPPTSGWGNDRVLLDDFGVAIGPDGGARIVWTDTRAAHTGNCTPSGTSAISCQSSGRHVMFACQTSGKGLHDETIIGCGQKQPTAVTVASFTARRAVHGVTVAWRTAAESDTFGFNVWRQGRLGMWHQVNKGLIRAMGGVAGRTYRFVDRTARLGSAYVYRLAIVNLKGLSRFAGRAHVAAR
jgi:hypothetical protein